MPASWRHDAFDLGLQQREELVRAEVGRASGNGPSGLVPSDGAYPVVTVLREEAHFLPASVLRVQPFEHDRPLELPQLFFVSRAGYLAHQDSGGAACNNAADAHLVVTQEKQRLFFDHGHFVIYIHCGR